MSAKSFSFKNIFLGVLLGIAGVAGWAFYPQIQSAVQTQAAVVPTEVPQQATAETDVPVAAPAAADTVPDEKVETPQPASQPLAAAETAERDPAGPATAESSQAAAVQATTDPMEASPGWNPEVAKGLLKPTNALQIPADGESQTGQPPVAAEQTDPVPVLPKTTSSSKLATVQQEEEARWQALLASPFFPERAEGYPFGACFKEAAAENRVPLPVLLGLAAYQSNFDPQVVSDSGFGILNVGWPRPAKKMGIERKEILIEDPCANISAGAEYFAALLKESQGQWVPALAAYRRLADPAYLGRIRAEDLDFSKELQRYVEEVIRQPYTPKTMYAFWEFDERVTAQRFMKMVEQQSGVHLWMGQRGFGYVIFVPAADPNEKDRKLELIEQETGLQAVLTQREDASS